MSLFTVGNATAHTPQRHPAENSPDTPQWPHRNEFKSSQITGGVGDTSTPYRPRPGQAGGALFVQSVVAPAFGRDRHAHYAGGGIVETILTGGSGGVVNLDAGVVKTGAPGAYDAGASAVGLRAYADGTRSTHHKGILTGMWPMVKSYASRTAGNIATAIEINTFTWFAWDPKRNDHYIRDPFDHPRQQCPTGLLINNYQQYAKVTGQPAGVAQNAFGIALANLGPADADGRAYGYQTGIYVSDCSREAVRIRCSVYGSPAERTDYGIKLEGRAEQAGIDIGPNKLRFGGHAGVLEKPGDMYFNSVSGVLFFEDHDSKRQVITCNRATPYRAGGATHKLRVRFGRREFELLAVEVAQ